MIRTLVIAVLAPWLAWAAGRCAVSAVPQQIAAEGAAEPAGAISLECSGLSAGQPIQGVASFSFSKRLANRRLGDQLEGPTLELETAPGAWAAFNVRATLNGASSLSFQGLSWTASSAGSFKLRLSGVRIEGAAEAIQAAAQLFTNERFDFPSPLTTVARGTPALAAALLPTLATRGPSPAPDSDFAAMVRLGSPTASVRVTENFPSALAQGTRILVRFSGVPDGVRMLLPDVVAGANALVPTRSGGFGRPAGPGLLSPFAGAQLLLIRIVDSEINGQGGRYAVNPPAAHQSFGQLRDASFSRGTPYAVFEVASSDPSRLESAEIPAWVAVPPRFDTPFGESVVQPTVALAPVSEVEGTHATAPIPRFRPLNPIPDCDLIGDCSAAWFPKMRINAPSPLNFTAAAGGGVQIGYGGIVNDGGGLLQWRVTARTRQGAGWLQVDPTTGVQNGGVRYDLNPLNLEPGEYTGDLVFEHIAPPTGRKDERVFEIRLNVTPRQTPPVTPPVTPPPGPTPDPQPPAAPPPIITGVSAGPAYLGPPFAPGSLVTIQGSGFSGLVEVTAAALPVRIVTASGTELSAVLPDDLSGARAALIVRVDGRASAAWILDVVPSAPVLLFALNQNGDRNAESAPAAAGELLDLYMTGVRAGSSVEVRVHDRVLSVTVEDGGLQGVRLVRVRIPADLPAMQTSAILSAAGAVSHPLDVWLR